MRLLPLALLLSLNGYAADVAPPEPPAVRRGLSPEAAAALKATLPKYVAPKPAAAQPAPGATSADGDAVEEPASGILRLPDYFVTEDKIRQFSEYEMLTPKGKIDLAFKRHPGLKVGNFLGMNRGIGLAMLQEEQAIETRRRAAELVSLATIGKASGDKELKAALRNIQLRPNN